MSDDTIGQLLTIALVLAGVGVVLSLAGLLVLVVGALL